MPLGKSRNGPVAPAKPEGCVRRRVEKGLPLPERASAIIAPSAPMTAMTPIVRGRRALLIGNKIRIGEIDAGGGLYDQAEGPFASYQRRLEVDAQDVFQHAAHPLAQVSPLTRIDGFSFPA